MIKPIVSSNKTAFKADVNTINPSTGEYKDPLMRWPLRGAAFTNEVGEALRPLIGEYATLSWAPALLYIGADIYDKYKNNETEYSPNSKRCLKQAIFQGMASILLPLVAVKTGQNLFSLFGMGSKDKISINSQEHITKLAQVFVANGKMIKYQDNDSECIKEFLDIVDNNLDFKKQEAFSNNPVKKLLLHIEEFLTKHCKVNTKENINKYAKNTINNLIQTRKDLLMPNDKFKKSSLYLDYVSAMNNGQTKNVAIKSVLNKYLTKGSLKGRTIKTAGGFIALGCAIKPIDHFVEQLLDKTFDVNKTTAH